MKLSESESNCFRTDCAVAFALENSAQACYQSRRFVELWLGQAAPLRELVVTANFVGIIERMRVQIGASVSQPHQIGHAPSRYQEQRQCAHESCDRTEVRRLDAASMLQYVRTPLHFPARSIPVDQFDRHDAHGRTGLTDGQTGGRKAFASACW